MNALMLEAARYMGYPGAPDGAGERLLAAAFDKLTAAAQPRASHVCFPCAVTPSGVSLSGTEAVFASRDLARTLMGCESLALMAATLGAAVDSLMRRSALTSVVEAAALQAASAALIEKVCDDEQSKIERETGLFTTMRFSPGYGDLSLAHQNELLALVRADRLGMSLTAGEMLAPTKSVTAIMGLSPTVRMKTHDCTGCNKTDCAFRKAR